MRSGLFSALLVSLFTIPLLAGVTGTVITTDGQPLAGAKVSLFAPETVAAKRLRLISKSPERVALASMQTDSKGTFNLDAPKNPVVMVSVEAKSYAPAATRAQNDEDLGAIALSSAETKRGTITAGGKPVAGATVSWQGATEMTAVTEADGHYSVPDPQKWATTLTIFHPDFAPVQETSNPLSAEAKRSVDRTLSAGVKVTGHVTSQDGTTPVGGADVLLDGWPVAKSGDDGTFAIEHAAQKWTEMEAFTADRSGSRVRSTTGEIVIKLTKAASLSGTVRDAKSQLPLANAEIFLSAQTPYRLTLPKASAFTDAKGNYSITSILPGNYEVEAERPGYAIAQQQASITSGQKQVKNFFGAQHARITGTVVDEDKHGVGGARLGVRPVEGGRGGGFMAMRLMTGTERGGWSAPDGRFVIRAAQTDEEVAVDANKKGFPSAKSSTLRLAPGDRKSGVVITIPRGLAVTGRVTDKDGKPLSGVAVAVDESRPRNPGLMRRMMMMMSRGGDESTVRTGSDGTFSIRLKEGTYDFVFKRDGFAPKNVRGTTVAPSAKPLEVTLDPGAEISGRVTRGGAGIEGVSVAANSETGVGVTMTAADGTFRIPDLQPGSLMLFVTKEGEFIQQMRNVTAPAKDVLIDLPSGGRITGRAVDKESHQPVTSFQAGISTARSGGGMVFMAPPQLRPFTSDDGSFVLENVPPGATQVVVTAPGYTSGRVSNVMVEEGKTVADVEVPLETGVRVTGKVTGPDGSPLSGVMVRTDQGDNSVRVVRIGAGSQSETTTDPNGEYVLETVEPGQTTIVATRQEYLSDSKSVTLSGKTAHVDLQLSAGMRATGVVVSETGVPVADVTVRASSGAAGGFGKSAQSDGSGAFVLEGLAPGHYQFDASKSGYADAIVRDVDITTGAPVQLVLRSGGIVFGHVTGLADNELQGATVYARGGETTASAPVDSSGAYRIEGAPIGSVRVYASSGRGFGTGRTSTSQTIDVAAGTPQPVDIAFKNDTTIRGRITHAGQPVTNASVSFYPRSGKTQTSARATTDGQGQYQVNGLDAATYGVQIMDSQRSLSYATTYDVAGSGTFDIDIKTGQIRGRVVSADSSEPLKDVVLNARADQEPLYSGHTGVTDATGAFLIDSVPPGSYHVTAELPGYGHDVEDVFVGSDGSAEDKTFKLAKTAGITLQIVDKRDQRPLGGEVRVTDSRGIVVYNSFYRFAEGTAPLNITVAPGTYSVTVQAQGYAPVTVPMSAPAQQTIGLTPGGSLVLLAKSSGLRGRLIDSGGRPYIVPDHAALFSISTSPTQLYNIAPGTYRLQVLDTQDKMVNEVPITIVEGQTAQTSV